MSFVHLALNLLAAFGVSYVIGHSRISLPVRNWVGKWALPVEAVEAVAVAKRSALQRLAAWFLALVECYACSGFWIGLAYGAATTRSATALTYAFAACGSNLLLSLLSGAAMSVKQERDAVQVEHAIDLGWGAVKTLVDSLHPATSEEKEEAKQ